MPTATFFENFQGRLPLLSVNLHSRKCRGRYFIYKKLQKTPRAIKIRNGDANIIVQIGANSKKMRRGFMKEMSIYDPKGEENLAKELQERVKNPVFVCIGTEKVFADSLGPRVGSLLNAQMSKPYFVYGLCNQNITAENLVYCHDFIKKMHPQSQLVVVDAAVGTTEQIGKIQISQGGIVPGAATNKNLPSIGDISIVGIVAERGMADFYTLNTSKEKLVNQVAQFIANSIMRANIC